MRRGRVRNIVAFVFVVVGFFLATHQQSLPMVANWLDISEAPQPADAVFALLGNNDTRPFVAAALYNAGYAEEVILAMNKPTSDNPQRPPTNDTYRQVLLRRGVPDEDILTLGRGATNTMNESEVLLAYFRDHPDANVTVVTSFFHTRRTRWSLNQTAGKYAKQLKYVSAPHDDFDASNWWLYHSGFELIIMEYIKLTAYWLLYGNAGWIALGLLLVIGVAWWRRPRANELQSEAATNLKD